MGEHRRAQGGHEVVEGGDLARLVPDELGIGRFRHQFTDADVAALRRQGAHSERHHYLDSSVLSPVDSPIPISSPRFARICRSLKD